MTNKHKIINDPVFGFLNIPNDLLYDVLQHPYVQRLNRIRQLGLSYFVYPGAMHSRFLHSIGAMHLMQEGIHSLREKGVQITDTEATGAMVAILLHDIGHGPFSHVLEHTLVDGITHEEISLMMMEQINQDLTPDNEEQIWQQRPLDEAIAIFKDEYPRHFLHQLISSQLDVDRMDYLCRDSFFCGVTEGSVASARLLKMLNVRDDKLVVELKGIYSVEKFLVARRLMYWQVYLHKTSVAAEQLLIKILSRAKKLASEGKELFCSPALHYFLYNHVTANEFSAGSEAMRQYALLDDSDVLSAIKAWITSDDRVLSLLSAAFTNRQLFRGRLLTEPLSDEEKQQMKEYYAGKCQVSIEDAEWFFVEHASTSNTYSEKDDSIDILYNDGTVRDIAGASEILDLKSLTRKPRKLYVFSYRI
ncbi:MAG: HD domain-containing protein [Paludibacteraceae bacterium]|nr:HD domain-containing protein [Paludibacteraceae bacterium]